MDWLTIAERFGLPCLILVAVGYAVAWIAKRLLGEQGVITLAAGRLFGDGGLAERVGGKYLTLMEALEDASRREAQFQTDSRAFQVAHGKQASTASEMLQQIRDNTNGLAAAGLHGCDLLEQVEMELQAVNSNVSWRPYLERIRESLRSLVQA